VTLQERDDLVPNLIGMIACVVKLQVGDRARRAADRRAVHAAHIADQRLGLWENLENILALWIELHTIDGDETDIVSTSVKADLPEPGYVQGIALTWRHGVSRTALVETYDCWVRLEFMSHGRPPVRLRQTCI
jgi:hypothetical protein